MFGIFRKKPRNVPTETHTLTIPLIEDKDRKVDVIADYMHKGTPILAVFNPTKKAMKDNGSWSINVLFGVEMNGLNPSVSMYRREGQLLCNYKAYVFPNQPLHFMLYEVSEFKNSNIMKLVNEELGDAYELYHDDDRICETQQFLVHDLTEEEALKYLKSHPDKRTMYVGKERCVKKEDSEADNNEN